MENLQSDSLCFFFFMYTNNNAADFGHSKFEEIGTVYGEEIWSLMFFILQRNITWCSLDIDVFYLTVQYHLVFHH